MTGIPSNARHTSGTEFYLANGDSDANQRAKRDVPVRFGHVELRKARTPFSKRYERSLTVCSLRVGCTNSVHAAQLYS